MRVRRPIVVTLLLAGVAGLIAALVPPSRCPLEVKLSRIVPSGIFNDDGNEYLLMYLTIRNRETRSFIFEANWTIQAKLTNCWGEVPQIPAFPTIYPGKTATALAMVPAGMDACRLRVNFRMAYQTWKARLLEMIGLRGRTLLAKSPLLCKLVWADARQAVRVSRHWRQSTVEVAFPPRGAEPARERVHVNVIFQSNAGRPGRRADSFCWESVNHQVGFSCPHRAGRLALLPPMLAPCRARLEHNKRTSRFMFNTLVADNE
ncbi:MAG: hypothetical protein NT154_09155 [Verrucomicrobia bacterium]|nr:hypothetical protein [Verrucomicrobiota bacterium]